VPIHWLVHGHVTSNNEAVSRPMPGAGIKALFPSKGKGNDDDDAMSRQHRENYDVKQETVHCYPQNVDRCCTSFVNNVIICFPPV